MAMETREQTRKKRKRYRRQKHQGNRWQNTWYSKYQEERKRIDESNRKRQRYDEIAYSILYGLLILSGLGVAACWALVKWGECPR